MTFLLRVCCADTMPRAYDMRCRLCLSVAGEDGLMSRFSNVMGRCDQRQGCGHHRCPPARILPEFDPAARGWLAKRTAIRRWLHSSNRQRDTPFLFITAFDFKNLISVSSSCLRNVSSATRTYAARSTMGLLYQNFSR